MQVSRLLLSVSLVAALALAAGPASAWTPASHEVIAREAARLAPPDLYRQLVRNRNAYVLGTTEPFKTRRIEDVNKNEDGSGRLDEVIARKVEEAIRAIELHRPFNDISYRLGVVSHYLAEANNPLRSSARDPEEPRYAVDFQRYLESAEPRFQLVFYGFDRRLDAPQSLPLLVGETLARSRSFYPAVGREYRRIGFVSGVRRFDDRSTAYGVAALSFSHAVSDIAQVLRYIWLRSGGADPRTKLPLRGQTRMIIPRSPAGS